MLAQRQRVKQHTEPPHDLAARMALAASNTTDERLYWGRQLYRRRRKWAQRFARQRFADCALRLHRTDRSVASKVSWVAGPSGARPYGVPRWGSDIIGPHYTRLFISSFGTAEEKRARLEGMECSLRAQTLDGSFHSVEFPMFVLFSLGRAKMHPNKPAGQDGLVAEMYFWIGLPWMSSVCLVSGA